MGLDGQVKVCMILNNNFAFDSRVLREATSLVRAGYKIVIYALKDESVKAHEVINGIEVRRVFRSSLVVPPYMMRYVQAFVDLCAALREERFDVYHCHDPDTLLFGYVFAKKNRAKLIYDSHEFWPAKKVSEAPDWIRFILWSIRRQVTGMVEGFCTRRAAGVITVNEALANEMSLHFGIERPLVLYNYQSIVL